MATDCVRSLVVVVSHATCGFVVFVEKKQILKANVVDEVLRNGSSRNTG